METCTMIDFMEAVKPWLSDDYIDQAYLDKEGHLVLIFSDGVKNVYQLTGCTAQDIQNVLGDFKKRGIRVRGG